MDHLFLSPLFGAIAGWFGIAIITLAAREDVALLGNAFRVVDWNMPGAPEALALAFLLGFSERFFDAVVRAVTEHAEVAKVADQAAKDASVPAGTQQAAGVAKSDGGTTTPPAASVDSNELQLEEGAISPVRQVTGKVILAKPADADTVVNLSSSHAEFEVQPAALTIAKGEKEGGFDVVPKGSAPAVTVRITARVGDVTMSKTIDYQ
jgi:hypothetical protein